MTREIEARAGVFIVCYSYSKVTRSSNNEELHLATFSQYKTMKQRPPKRVTFSAKDDVAIIESSFYIASPTSEVRATKGLSRIFASTFSIVFVLLALLLPVDNASHVASSLDGGAFSTPNTRSTESSPSSHPPPRRGKFVGDTFDAKDLYEAYKEVETEYHTKAFRDAADWRVLASRQEVEVSMMEHPSDPNCPYVKMVAVIPASVQECWSWLSLSNWPKNMPKMDPFYEGVDLHGDYDYKGVSMILARKRTKRILAFGKRDIVFLSVSDQPLSDGTWVSGSVSVETPQIPRQTAYTRAFQDSIAFYKPLEGNTKTRVTIVCRIDLNDSSAEGAGGWIPMWLYVKTIGATGVRSVTSMRDVITKEYAEKQLYLPQMEDKVLDPTRFNFWKRRIAGISLNSDPIKDETTIPEIEGPTPDHGKRWKFPWGKEPQSPSIPPKVDQAPILAGGTVRSHRVPRFFFKR